jgi:hypothetical protein
MKKKIERIKGKETSTKKKIKINKLEGLEFKKKQRREIERRKTVQYLGIRTCL